jgi:hypothetical protein
MNSSISPEKSYIAHYHFNFDLQGAMTGGVNKYWLFTARQHRRKSLSRCTDNTLRPRLSSGASSGEVKHILPDREF